MYGCRLVGEPEPVQRFMQPIPTTVSGKYASGSVPPMCRGREAQDIEPGVGISESRDRLTPIGPLAELASFIPGNSFSVGNQSGTARAGDDLVVEHCQGGHRREVYQNQEMLVPRRACC